MQPEPGYDFCEFLPAFLQPTRTEAPTNTTYNFGIGDIHGVPGYEEILRSALQDTLSDAAGYLVRLPGQQGFGPLCEQLAVVHSSISGRSFTAERVLLTEGGCSGISIALAAAQHPGAKVAYAVPAFPYWCTLKSLGLVSAPILFEDPHEYAATFGDRLMEAVENDPAIRAVILNEPQNPMGFPLEETQLKRIGELADEHDIQVVVDDVAATFAFRAQGWAGRYIDDSRCYIVGSFTKQYAVPGLRLGWLIPPADSLAATRSIVANLRAGVCNLAAVFGSCLLKHIEKQPRQDPITHEIQRRVEVTGRLREASASGLHFWPSGQGLYVLGRVTTRATTPALLAFLAEHGVRMLGHRFLFPPLQSQSFHGQMIRFSIGAEERVSDGIDEMLLSLELAAQREAAT